MNALVEANDVAKKSGHGGKRPGAGRPKTERDDVAIKIDRRIAARIYFIARARGISAAQYLDGIAPTVDRDFKKIAGEG